MSDLVVAASLTRTELALADLSLQQPGFCRVVAYDPSGVTRRRVVAKSPTVKGHIQTGSVEDSGVVNLALRLFGTSKSTLDANVQTVQDGFSQISYQLSIVINGATVTWQCDDAEWSLRPDAGELGVDKFALMANQQVWQFTIPTQPVPLAGVF